MSATRHALNGSWLLTIKNERQLTIPFDVINLICNVLQGRDLIAFAAACKTLRVCVHMHLRHTTSFNSKVHRYFPSSAHGKIRQAMDDYHMVISGSVALSFFTRTHPLPDNIDIYLPCNNVLQAIRWFRAHFKQKGVLSHKINRPSQSTVPRESTTYAVRTDIQPQYYDPSIASITTFVFKSLKVHVIACIKGPMETLGRFQCTIHFNIVTARAAYCFYPTATLNIKVGLINRRRNLADMNIIEKYKHRGYRMIYGLRRGSSRKDPRSLFNESRRFVGDTKCWTIPLDKDLTEPLEDPFQMNSWEIWFNRDEKWLGQVSYSLLTSPFLKSCYLLADDITLDTLKAAVVKSPTVLQYSQSANTSSPLSTSDSDSDSSNFTDSTSQTSDIYDIDDSIATMSVPLHTKPNNIYIDLDVLSAVKNAFPGSFTNTNICCIPP
ncbi:hypothetical protein BJ165DRAFT_1529778 [Panaeolus papilionaceus]|nr:hypothetical protein BJ165DRAFT_1529778 [Panaeolus papilionaceus]